MSIRIAVFVCAAIVSCAGDVFAGDAGIELRFEAGACPSREQVLKFVRALGGAKVSARVEVVKVTAEPPRWRIAVVARGARVVREVAAVGACDRQAALIAAVIDRAVRGGVAGRPKVGRAGEASPSSKLAATATAAATAAATGSPTPPIAAPPEASDEGGTTAVTSSTVASTVASTAPIEVAGSTETPATAAALATAPGSIPRTSTSSFVSVAPAEISISIGALAGIGNTGEVAPGFEVGGAWISAIGVGVGARVVWMIPRVEPAGAAGRVRVDQVRFDGALVVALSPILRGEVSVLARGVAAASEALPVTDRALRVDPGAGLGLTLLPSLGPVRAGVSLRAHIFVEAHRFRVDQAPIIEVPAGEVELALQAALPL